MLSRSRQASDPSLSPEIERLLTDIAEDGFVVYCCGPRDDPTALAASYEWPSHVDLVTIRDFDLITAARVPEPDSGTLDIFAPDTAVWAYQGPAQTTLRALLDLVHPQHPDAPDVPFPAPRSLHIARHQQRPMTIRHRAGRLEAGTLSVPASTKFRLSARQHRRSRRGPMTRAGRTLLRFLGARSRKPTAATGYAAFISYSHAVDGKLAPAVQRGLERLTRPWWGRRALRVFRDDTGLAVTPELWGAIAAALLASCDDNGVVRRWDARTGEPVSEPIVAHDGAIWGVAISADGRMVASSGDDMVVRRWESGRMVGEALVGHGYAVNGLAFSTDGTIVSTGFDGSVRRWNSGTGEPVGASMPGATGPLFAHTLAGNGLAMDSTGTVIYSAAFDGAIRGWLGPTGSEYGPPIKDPETNALAIALSPQLDRIASTSLDGTVRLWSTLGGEAIGRPLLGHAGSARTVAFSPDGTTIASGGSDDTVRRWDVGTGAAAGPPLTGHLDAVTGVTFSPDGEVIISAGHDRSVRRWDARSGDPVSEPLQSGGDDVRLGLAVSPDGKMIVAADASGTIHRWDASSGAVIDELAGHDGRANSVAFSPDSKVLASAGDDGTIRLWDAGSGKLIQVWKAGRSGISTVAFGPGGDVVASAGDDGFVRLWDAGTGEPRLTWRAARGAIRVVAFSPDGETIASLGSTPDDTPGSANMSIDGWPVSIDVWIEHACTLAGRNLRQDEWDQYIGADRPYYRACADLPPGQGASLEAPAAQYPFG